MNSERDTTKTPWARLDAVNAVLKYDLLLPPYLINDLRLTQFEPSITKLTTHATNNKPWIGQVAQRVSELLAGTLHPNTSTGNSRSNNSNNGGCTFKEFSSLSLTSFDGTRGAVALTR